MKKYFACFSAAVLSATILASAGAGTVSANAVAPVTQEAVRPPLQVKNANPSLHFDVQFEAQFKAKITNRQTKAVTYVDLRQGKSEYVTAGIYSKEGYLLRAVKGMYDPLHELAPVMQKNGVTLYEGHQTIWGMHNADLLGTVSSTWTVQNNQWKVVNVKVTPYDRSFKPYPPVWINTAYVVNVAKVDNTFILDVKQAELNGDDKIDSVLLIGHKPGMALNLMTDELQVVMIDGETNQKIVAPVGGLAKGYVPSLNVGDYNGDKVMDVYVTMPNGGSVGQTAYSLLTFTNNKPVVTIPQLPSAQLTPVVKR